MKDYTELDEAILNHFRYLNGDDPRVSPALVQKVRLANTYNQDVAWRLINRRMQALRKEGKIQFVRGSQRWDLTLDYRLATHRP